MNLRFECNDVRYDVDITLTDRMTIIVDCTTSWCTLSFNTKKFSLERVQTYE